MKAVNLLPERYRPRRPSNRQSNGAYVLIGVLGAVLVAVLVYVLTLNSINSDRDQIAQAKADTQRFQTESQQLGPYGDFSKIKTQRVNAVRQLAEGRFDWERLVRELSSVLPEGVWLTNAAAADSMADASDSDAGSGFQQSTSGSSSSSSSATPAAAPVMTIEGCARDQGAVATTLVRLRELQDAAQVQLDHSTQPEQSGSSGGSSSSSSGSNSDCGSTAGHANYSFQVDVAFVAPKAAPYTPGQVPASLGGGQ